jgi:superfamily II DNA or RNA helicase
MSLKINIDSLTDEHRNLINDNLIIKIKNTKYNKFAPQKIIYPYLLENDMILLPFAYSIRELKMSRPSRDEYPAMNVKFEGQLRSEQEIVKKESLNILSKTGSVMISLATGMGKTITSINLACHIKLKTLVVVNKIVLIKQWEEAILKVCPSATIQKVSTKSELQDCDFYIINAINVEKMGKSFFIDIGNCIVDECHLIMAETLAKSLYYVYPRYLIGLSATPYRVDGLDPLLSFYFGEDKIIRLLHREHLVYKVNTGFTPEIVLTKDGKVNWGALLDQQANNKERNELIIDIVKRFSDRNILILSKRVEQGEYILNRLKEEGEYVDSLIGSKQEFDRESRILVATTSKAGTGFDYAKLDCLILACDLESYFIQALGRVLRRPDVKPIVFDLLDDNRILESHFKTRKQVYLDIGGKIKKYS